MLSFKDLVLQLFFSIFLGFFPPLIWSFELQWEVAELVLPYLAAKVHLSWLFCFFSLVLRITN